jgi:hypothetical protein
MSETAGLEFIRETSWEEILRVWRAREEEVWRPHYETRGFRSWFDWRMRYMKQFTPETRTWSLYRVLDPAAMIPNFYVGAFHGWRKYYPSESTVATFAAIAEQPELARNETVQRLLAGASLGERQIMGFRGDGKIVVRDGTHHCATIALSAKLGRDILAPTTIALADFSPSESEFFLQSYDQRFAPQP